MESSAQHSEHQQAEHAERRAVLREALPGAAAPLHLDVPLQQDSVLVSASVALNHPKPNQEACTWHALPSEKQAKKENGA